MTTPFTPTALTVDQLAARWGVSAGAIYRRIKNREIPVIPLGGAIKRVPLAYVEEAEKCDLSRTVENGPSGSTAGAIQPESTPPAAGPATVATLPNRRRARL